ncbi:MAG: sterol desaturase family protein [Pseudomonadota bacterium]|nr:sterol desaturase family protein [Pseudomonadota bacterium]
MLNAVETRRVCRREPGVAHERHKGTSDHCQARPKIQEADVNLALPTLFTVLVAAVFLVFERVVPGRELPNSHGWYIRAALINLCQIAITFATNGLWVNVFSGAPAFHLANFHMPVAEGFIGWFVGTFFFYWWHRIRHLNGFWELFHQVHHSPARIEAMTSFYKHPIEILSDSALAATILYILLGASLEGALWFNFFAAAGEFFYHSNFKSPSWLKYFIQTPELHSIHHQRGVHRYNFADVPIWDWIFGTYKDTNIFAECCGFPRDNERKLGRMLVFRNVYDS